MKIHKEELIKRFEKFTEKNDFKLNPDQKHVNFLINGLFKNEKRFGLKLCPCRVRDETKARDLELLCPCNFKTHTTWKEKGMCWCGLFVKR